MLPSRIKPLSTSHPPSQQPSKNKQPKPEPEDQDDEAEDHLSSFLHHLFPDEAPPCLGEPGQSLLYSSDLFGDLTVKLPDYSSSTTTTTTTDDHPESKGTQTEAEASITEENEQGDVETGRRLFAHYLWGGALVIAEGIEAATRIERESKDHILGEVADAKRWSVKGHKVLEVGAGAALPSIVSALSGADTVTITDHPSSSALYGAIQANISENIPQHERNKVSVQPYEWGVFEDQALDSLSTTSQPVVQKMAQFATTNKANYSRILCADCLWMRGQHVNLIRTLLWFLTPPAAAGTGTGTTGSASIEEDPSLDASGGRVWVVAGFHTGREIVASFFETAVSMGLAIEQIWEMDVNATYEEGEVTRPWRPVRDGEGPENRARWCVVGILSRRH